MPARRHLARLACLATAAVIAAACGGGGGSTPNDASTPGETGPPGQTSTPGGGSATDDASDEVVRCGSFEPDCVEVLPPDTVELRGVLFRPAELTVAAGTTVTFVNLDTVAHTVTAGTPEDPDDASFDLPLRAENDTDTITFDEPGTYPYFCVIHPGPMRAVVVVE